MIILNLYVIIALVSSVLTHSLSKNSACSNLPVSVDYGSSNYGSENEGCPQSGIFNFDLDRIDPKTGALISAKVSYELLAGGQLNFNNNNVTCDNNGGGYKGSGEDNKCPRGGDYMFGICHIDLKTRVKKSVRAFTKLDDAGTLDPKFVVKCDGGPEKCDGVFPPGTYAFRVYRVNTTTGSNNPVTIIFKLEADGILYPKERVIC